MTITMVSAKRTNRKGSSTAKRSSHDRLETGQANEEARKESHDNGSVQHWAEVPALLLSEMAAVRPAWGA